MAGVSISAIAAIATDRCLLRRKDKISHPSIVANDNGSARLSVARPGDAKTLRRHADNSIQMRLWMFAFG
jgi:hypothetical protein